MHNIKFSFIIPSISADNCLRLYNNLIKKSKYIFEIIMVGPNRPIFKLPLNFIYIYSDVKITQCLEIAVRNSNGEYIIPSVDDILFPPYFIKTLNRYTKIVDMKKTYIGLWHFNNTFKNEIMNFVKRTVPSQENKRKKIYTNVPLFSYEKMVMSLVLKKDIWYKIGGIDRRFIASYWMEDMQKRLEEKSIKKVVFLECFFHEVRPLKRKNIKKQKRKSITIKCLPYDKKIYETFWIKPNRKHSDKRLVPVESFVNKNIMWFSQYNNEEWEKIQRKRNKRKGYFKNIFENYYRKRIKRIKNESIYYRNNRFCRKSFSRLSIRTNIR